MSNYPDALDTDLELPRVDREVSEISGDAINALRDAIFSIQTAIGINPQGDVSTLVARINGVIDADGNLKTSALANKGLVSLPINDTHIDDDASIAESKIDLDYTTAYLNARISQNVSDLNTHKTSFNSFVADVFKHYAAVLRP